MGIPKGETYKLIVKEHSPHQWTWHLYSNNNKTVIVESPHKFKTSRAAKVSFENTMMNAFKWLSQNHVIYDRCPYVQSNNP